MTKTTIAGGAAAVLAILALGYGALGWAEGPDAAAPPTLPPPDAPLVEAPDFLYGRVVTHDGDVYEGRLRWGGDEEAFWDDYFNGVKDENPWAGHALVAELAEERRPAEVLGFELPWSEPEVDLGRPFMARFGDIVRIESRGDGVRGVIQDGAAFDPDVRVTLKSGAAFDLDRLDASDFDDGVRVWDRRGVVDLGARSIRRVDLLPTARLRGAPDRLHGTVQTRQGAFTGFLQWDREGALVSDELVGRTPDGELRLRFGDVRSIARRSDGGSLVTLDDGREVALSGTRAVDRGNRGVSVDDPRYGRVLVSWDAFQRIDFSPTGAGSGPAYGDFPPGGPLTGTVTVRDGRRLAGRLVFDLDESETAETLDAPAGGVDYTVPFGRIARIAIPNGGGRARLTLRTGGQLELERSGDLGEGNAGILVLADPDERSAYVPWDAVAQIDLDPPPDGARDAP